jgi:uncharacterized protein
MSEMSGAYHEGEIAVQERAGVRETARKVGGIIGNAMPPVAAAFIEEQRFAVAGFADGEGRVWASLLVGEPGFLHSDTESTLTVERLPPASDPLTARLQEVEDGLPLGLLVIYLRDRKRMRANGTAYPRANGFDLHLSEVYSNCPKYIQSREISTEDRIEGTAVIVSRGTVLTDEQRAFVSQADTLFIATRHPQRGVDASHRGGMPGFVRILDERTLVFPDYAGNRMFNTLGNLQVEPAAGLLFVDWATGATLQLTGDAQTLWAEEVTAVEQDLGESLVGAQGRAVRLTLREWRQTNGERGGLRETQFIAYSPANPKAE